MRRHLLWIYIGIHSRLLATSHENYPHYSGNLPELQGCLNHPIHWPDRLVWRVQRRWGRNIHIREKWRAWVKCGYNDSKSKPLTSQQRFDNSWPIQSYPQVGNFLRRARDRRLLQTKRSSTFLPTRRHNLQTFKTKYFHKLWLGTWRRHELLEYRMFRLVSTGSD